MFQAHINVESCQSVKSFKYICKYVNKGSDQAVFQLQKNGANLDEVSAFQTGRYISSNEAVWRILSFPIHERFPTVVHLNIHLENGQRVYFTKENVQQQLQNAPKTTLTAFFDLCKTDNFAKTILYCDVPRYYTWNASAKIFQRRKQGADVDGYPGVKSTEALGRVYTVHPTSNAECFFLRMLLHVIKGPTSFTDLKTVEDQVCETFREACQRRGLLENDQHWEMAMAEASAVQSPSRLRHLFCILLTACAISNPLLLWEKFKENLSEDILLQLRRDNLQLQVNFSPDIFNKALIFLEDICLSMSGRDLNQYGLPSPQRSSNNHLSTEILRETNYNTHALEKLVVTNEPLLLPDQSAFYYEVLNAIHGKKGGLFFLDAPGGTGKTFVLNLLLAKIRQQKRIALAVASSGIAATLLEGGRTGHSTFKLPLNLAHDAEPVCNIPKGSGQAKVLQQCSVIVWDECTMSHKRAFEALDRTLKDLRENHALMGGLVVVLAGDFRQTLPVIPRSAPADELNACLKASYLWSHVRKMSLTTNMRVHLIGDVSSGHFSKQLLLLGEGKAPSDPETGLITFPLNFCNITKSIE